MVWKALEEDLLYIHDSIYHINFHKFDADGRASGCRTWRNHGRILNVGMCKYNCIFNFNSIYG